MTDSSRANRRVAWMLAGLIALSFAFGVAMFVAPQHRAQKLQEMEFRYRSRQPLLRPVAVVPAHQPPGDEIR